METEIKYSLLNISSFSKNEINFFKNEGYLVLPEIIEEKSVEKINKEILDIMKVIGLGNSKLRQTTQYLEGSLLDKLVNDENLKSLAEQLLGGPGSVYMPFTAVKSANGGGKFHFHQDNQYTKFDNPGINFWFALSDMNPENGCLQIIPRSHKNGTYEADPSGDGDSHKKIKWEPEDFLPVRMRKGDCVVFTRLTIHGSGSNLSGEQRVAYAIQFHRDDVHAKWGNNDWVLLKENPRWNTAPVKKIIPPEDVSLDGH